SDAASAASWFSGVSKLTTILPSVFALWLELPHPASPISTSAAKHTSPARTTEVSPTARTAERGSGRRPPYRPRLASAPLLAGLPIGVAFCLSLLWLVADAVQLVRMVWAAVGAARAEAQEAQRAAATPLPRRRARSARGSPRRRTPAERAAATARRRER